MREKKKRPAAGRARVRAQTSGTTARGRDARPKPTHATPHTHTTLTHTHTASTGGGAPATPIGGLLSKLDIGASLISGAGRGARDKLAGGLEAVLGALLDNNLGDNSFLKPAGVFGEWTGEGRGRECARAG